MTDEATAVLDPPAATNAELASYMESDWGRMSETERDAEITAARTELAKEDKPPVADATIKETPVKSDETPAVDDAAKPTDEGEGEGESWIDDETKAFASAMGLSEEELSSFGSRDELDRALRIIDRKAFEAAKAPAKPAEAPKPEVKAAPSEQTTDDALAKLEGIKWDDELGVEDAPKIRDAFAAVVAELKHQRAELAEQKTFRGTLQQQQAQDAAQQLRTKAVESLHALGHKDLFGEPGGEPTAAQRANIEKALEAHYIHARGLLASGRKPAPTPDFLRSAVNLAFGDKLNQKAVTRKADALRKSASRRTGGGTSKPSVDYNSHFKKDGETDEQFAQRRGNAADVMAKFKYYAEGGDKG